MVSPNAEKNSLRMLENREFREMFTLGGEEVTGDWRKLNNKIFLIYMG